MHLKARKDYRLSKAKKTKIVDPTIEMKKKEGYDVRHQQWLEDLEELENKPMETVAVAMPV